MPPKILVIRLSSLGDIALTAPVYRNLKAHWPGCRVAVLVKRAFAPLLEGHPCVDEVLPFDGFWSALRRVRAGGFTHLLDLHANLRSRALALLARVPNVSVYRKAALARRVFVACGWASPALARHTIDRYLDALAPWGVPVHERGLELGDSRAAPLPASASAAPRVLVLQTAFLGDGTLTIPLLEALKSAVPGCRRTLVTRPQSAELFRGHAEEIWTDDKRGGVLGLWRLSRRLAAGRFSLALVPHRSLRSALAVWLAGIPERIGFSSSAGRWLYTRALPFTWGMHDLERNLSLLLPVRPAFRPSEDFSVYLRPRDSGPSSAIGKRLAAENPPRGARLVGVHPGSAWPTKRWPAERYAALLRRLARERDARAVLVGSAADRELAAEIVSRAGVPAIDWTGRTTLTELIDLMGWLSLFITNDSGPMHIATGSGVPTLAIFGPTTRELGFFPYGEGHRVLEVDLPCRPCGLHGAARCPRGHFLCMKLISVEEAFQAASRMLERAPALPSPA